MISRARVSNGLLTLTVLFLSLAALPSRAQPTDVVRVVSDESGERLQVNGRDTMVFGMNWDYFPIGTNYSYNFWGQSDEFIEGALAREMPLMRAMGVNAIRVYVGIPARWIEHIYDRYGIYTILNHTLARYGYNLDGTWTAKVDYANPRLREAVKAEVLSIVEEYRGTRGLLMWLLGNENNYGLSWTSFEIEALPEGERNAARARFLYSLYGETIDGIKELDPNHPVAIANGDIQYIDLIAQECKSLDILGTNVYRGISVRDLYDVVKAKLGIPVMFTEFGADAYNAREMREDQVMQARYLIGQWQEIYEMSAGKGRAGNAIGGVIFQWTDGWWKYKQEERLDMHDTNASWPNGGYAEDFVEGDNNMNEEWWGITAKGQPDFSGQYDVYPRAAYYALRKAFALDPYAPDTDLAKIREHYGSIHPATAALEARGNTAMQKSSAPGLVSVRNVRMEFETFSTGGSNISTPEQDEAGTKVPAFLGFDNLQSFYTDFEVRPSGNVVGTVSINILGNVPVNPIDEIFYEDRGRRQTIEVDGEPLPLDDIERVKVYNATVSWEDRWFSLNGFYRAGHLHWGHEGDFFGIYRDAYYGDNIDIYNGIAPVGVEIAAKKKLKGLKLAFGPELYWGANPAFLVKYQRRIGSVNWTALYQNEFQQRLESVSSLAVPRPATKRASLSFATRVGPFDVTAGGIWAGEALVGRTFQVMEVTEGDTLILLDEVRDEDTFGGRVKVSLERGRWHWYGQYAYAGIVANGGPDALITFTGWSLKNPGAGNGNLVSTGLAVNVGKFQIGPNFFWQKPLVGPIPGDAPWPGQPRNVIDDPFAVRGNRETRAVELMLTYDPTPATWMWAWDNVVREDARLAWSLGVIYRDFPTTMDAAIGVLEDGKTFFAFPGATPPRDLWEVRSRIVSALRTDRRLVVNLFVGTGEPNGDDTRLVEFFGGDARFTTKSWAFLGFAKAGDWGPFDYHRDFNMTFPVHLMADVSRTLGMPRWFGYPQTKVGVRYTWRSLNEYSNRYCPGTTLDPQGNPVCEPTLPGDNGTEWEFRTYLQVTL